MTTIRQTAAHLETVEAPGAMLTRTAAKALAVTRISLGFVFLWAFLDKTFGLGYSTPWERAWINGGSPTKGFLSSVEAGPLQGFFHSIAGAGWANWSFMLGMLAIGVALVGGIGLRLAAVGATAMMLLMWLAEWPLAGGSSNPVVDYHFIYAVAAIALTLTYAGHTWGLGRRWAKLPLVQKNRWLI
ncbi:membrane protein [Paractinoplanes abujensis]|uniref:Thiosulfate dehydrogenase [quinone] large subunit n=1 Tax=Paractinoplanes abujensis TaxID=882441 RepID=A0A7W7CTV0_9ACTN|nr:DoxX family membrane protein [Actinoplanes abujensis]MBB4694602.1 thiosulfate dehydrogenase [quinone] large subunit [Actinoplanes abujensis]GID20183.1 membrane protein [Actinoplanes abujensis]